MPGEREETIRPGAAGGHSPGLQPSSWTATAVCWLPSLELWGPETRAEQPGPWGEEGCRTLSLIAKFYPFLKKYPSFLRPRSTLLPLPGAHSLWGHGGFPGSPRYLI